MTPPLQIGLYHDKSLFRTIKSEEKTSDALPALFEQILKKYQPQALYYAKGPGSFMAIKVSYIFLRTLSITKNIPLFATDGFTFNQNTPIKAVGSLYFMKKDGKIATQKKGGDFKPHNFTLPEILKSQNFTHESEPLYVLPAV